MCVSGIIKNCLHSIFLLNRNVIKGILMEAQQKFNFSIEVSVNFFTLEMKEEFRKKGPQKTFSVTLSGQTERIF